MREQAAQQLVRKLLTVHARRKKKTGKSRRRRRTSGKPNRTMIRIIQHPAAA